MLQPLVLCIPALERHSLHAAAIRPFQRVAEQVTLHLTAAPVAMPQGTTQPVPGTNNEAERTLRGPAMARKTGRTNKTPAGAQRDPMRRPES